MKKYFILFIICFLIISLPIGFANEIKSNSVKAQATPIDAYPGLTTQIAQLLSTYGFTYVKIGAAVIAGAYLVYRVSYSVWKYYKPYSYSNLVEYTHINEFSNIWGNNKPTRKQFEDMCKKNMNSKSVERYVQVADGRNIAYNPSTKMLTVGDTNGKDIITCFQKKRADVDKEVSKGRWKKIK